MVAQFIPQSHVSSVTARSIERTAYLKAHLSVVERSIAMYFEAEPEGEQVTLTVLRALRPLVAPRKGAAPDTLKQDIGLFVPIVLCQMAGPENVQTYRDDSSGRSSTRTVSAAWADLQDFVSRYTPHRLTPTGLRRLFAWRQEIGRKKGP